MKSPDFHSLSVNNSSTEGGRIEARSFTQGASEKHVISENEHVELVLKSIEDSHVDITQHEQDWVNVIMAFATDFGEAGREYAHRVSRFYPQYSPKEVDEKFDWCLTHNKGKIHVATFIQIAKDYGVNVSLPKDLMPADPQKSPKKLGRPKKEEKEPPMVLAKKMLDECAEWKFNVFTEQTLYLMKGEENERWQALDDREFNTFYTRVKSSGIRINKTDFESVIKSKDLSLSYNPAVEYLDKLPPYDPEATYVPIIEGAKDAIDDFFMHLKFKDPNKQAFYLKMGRKWFLNMVALMAGVIDENQFMIVLVGTQNAGKSHFCKNILPPELIEYFRLITPDTIMDKDLSIALSENIVILFDEITFKGNANTMKAFISAGTTKVRRSYDRNAKNRKRLASIVGTSNDKQYLPDNTGDRRYLSMEVVGTYNFIDYPLPYEQAYAEAYYLIHLPDFRSYLTQEEVSEISDNNMEFAAPNACRECILKYFRIPNGDERGQYLTPTEIKEVILSGTRLSSMDLPLNSIGKAMNYLGFQCIRPKGRVKYLVMKYETGEYDKISADESEEYLNELQAQSSTPEVLSDNDGGFSVASDVAPAHTPDDSSIFSQDMLDELYSKEEGDEDVE